MTQMMMRLLRQIIYSYLAVMNSYLWASSRRMIINYYIRKWRHVQYLENSFWKRWLASYLPMLQMRQKWQRVRKTNKVGDIMLIVDMNSPRSCWPLGLFIDVKVGRDNCVRTVKLRSHTTDF